MSNKDFNALIKKLHELDEEAGQEVAMRVVKQAGAIVQSQAKLSINSDTGALARSVKKKYEVDGDKVTATVYTKSEYAAYYEFGTGPIGQENHDGISPLVNPCYSQRGWMIPADKMSIEKAQSYGLGIAKKNGEVIGYYTKGQMAKPFMYPALHDHINDINKNTKRLLKRKLKELCKK